MTDHATTDHADLHRKLRLTPGSELWLWPEDSPAPDELATIEDVSHTSLGEADVAVLITRERADVDAALTAHLDALAAMRAVWLVYPKGNAADMNRDTLWVQLADYGWRAVSQVSFSPQLSALRVRPLRPGEEVRTG